MLSLKNKKIFVAGHNGMVGRALLRRLATEDAELLTIDKNKLDLRNQDAVNVWINNNKPDIIILAAATVGGIHANQSFPADFLYNNLMIAANVINAAKECNVEKLLFLGSACIYPKITPQPIKEEALLTDSLEPTNSWYAIAKIAGLKLTEAYRIQYNCNFISCMPTNLYGPFDNYDLQNSHVFPALLRKIHEAKKNNSVACIWGTGTAKREFLYVDDLADACIHLIKYYSGNETINIGTGKDITITELAQKIATIIGYSGKFKYNNSMPDGTPQRLLDISKLQKLGWKPTITLDTGIKLCYNSYLKELNIKEEIK
jgi:GDP-L-fucose synthase